MVAKLTHYSTGKAPAPTSRTANEQPTPGPRATAKWKSHRDSQALLHLAVGPSTHGASDRKSKEMTHD